jgi:NADH-quinone oxidoreductase subunit A
MELYTPVLVLGILAAGFAVFSVIMSSLVGPKRYNRAKLDSYECGIEPTPQPVGGGRFPVKYYITAMMFIVFDIEIIFLYPWAVNFARHVDIDDLDPLVDAFEDGLVVETGEMVPSTDYVRAMRDAPGLERVVRSLGAKGSPAVVASAVEFVLEGLHLNRRLNKDRLGAGARYRR